MTPAAPTLAQIQAQVEAILKKFPQTRAIGIRTSGRWTSEIPPRQGAKELSIRQCDSPLAMRLALREDAAEDVVKVILTGLEERQLGEDVLNRLAKRRLFQLDAWNLVQSSTGATNVDPRLWRLSWMPDLLLSFVSENSLPVARGGFLDAEAVWPFLLEHVAGWTGETFDLTSLLRWSLDPELCGRWRRASEEFRTGAKAWIVERAGLAAELIIGCIESLDQTDAVPIGLAASALFHPEAIGRAEGAVARLEERFLGGSPADPAAMRRWSSAALEVVRPLRFSDLQNHRRLVNRSDTILTELRAESLVELSEFSLLGYDQRYSLAGEALLAVSSSGEEAALDDMLKSLERIKRHDQAAFDRRRVERVEMSLRLARWLRSIRARSVTETSSLAEAVVDYSQQGGYVDWARTVLRAGDPVQVVSSAYARLLDEATRIREHQSREFARLLCEWTSAGSRTAQVIPVESILEEVVSPLAAVAPVLIVVMDGMSVAVWRELLADIAQDGWSALRRVSDPGALWGLATIPSATEFSRTSLLCGSLTRGAARDEVAGFAAHSALVSSSSSAAPPVLFHKAALREDGVANLAKVVREAIQSSRRKVVGVVVNALDDHLSKGEQIDTRWTRDTLPLLAGLLHEARLAKRLVVLLSDHGHILEMGTQERASDGGERWRGASDEPAEGEFCINGSRVLAGQQLIAPWSERLRYGPRRNGYHGGISPQEMIVPIVVLSGTGEVPDGWRELFEDTPAWWADTPASSRPVTPVSATMLRPREPREEGLLFSMEPGPKVPTNTTCAALPAWINLLLTSPLLAEQRRLAGRGAPGDETLGELLAALECGGGSMTGIALARALGIPPLRLPGLVAKVQRMLNVDGYEVLGLDDASDTIRLNRELLLRQFDLLRESSDAH